jgi:phage/plasmid-associated DNA primase
MNREELATFWDDCADEEEASAKLNAAKAERARIPYVRELYLAWAEVDRSEARRHRMMAEEARKSGIEAA